MAFAIRSARANVSEASYDSIAAMNAAQLTRRPAFAEEEELCGLSLRLPAGHNVAETSEEESAVALRHAGLCSGLILRERGVIRPRALCVFRASPSALATCCVSAPAAQPRHSGLRP